MGLAHWWLWGLLSSFLDTGHGFLSKLWKVNIFEASDVDCMAWSITYHFQENFMSRGFCSHTLWIKVQCPNRHTGPVLYLYIHIISTVKTFWKTSNMIEMFGIHVSKQVLLPWNLCKWCGLEESCHLFTVFSKQGHNPRRSANGLN